MVEMTKTLYFSYEAIGLRPFGFPIPAFVMRGISSIGARLVLSFVKLVVLKTYSNSSIFIFFKKIYFKNIQKNCNFYPNQLFTFTVYKLKIGQNEMLATSRDLPSQRDTKQKMLF